MRLLASLPRLASALVAVAFVAALALMPGPGPVAGSPGIVAGGVNCPPPDALPPDLPGSNVTGPNC
jgi:hypothetical protein